MAVTCVADNNTCSTQARGENISAVDARTEALARVSRLKAMGTAELGQIRLKLKGLDSVLVSCLVLGPFIKRGDGRDA